MNVLTNEKLTIVGAAGMIGSNIAVYTIRMLRVWKVLLKNCSIVVSKV